MYDEIPDLSVCYECKVSNLSEDPQELFAKRLEKCTSGHLMDCYTEGEMEYKIYVPELKEIVTCVNCLFNEVIPTYREEYFSRTK